MTSGIAQNARATPQAPDAALLGEALASLLARLASELEAVGSLILDGGRVEGLDRLEACLGLWRRVLESVRSGLRSAHLDLPPETLETWTARVAEELRRYGDPASQGTAGDLGRLCRHVLAPLAREGAGICRGERPAPDTGRFVSLSADRWRRNVAALRRANAELARRVEAEGARLGLGHDRVVDAADFFTPPPPRGGRAERCALLRPEGEAEVALGDLRFSGALGCVLFGFGAGHAARPLLSRASPDAWILVVEGSESAFCRAVALNDLEDLFRRPRTRLFVGGDRPSFYRWLGGIFTELYAVDFACIDHHPSLRSDPSFYEFARRAFRDAIHKRRIEMVTLEKIGLHLERNTLSNVPEVLAARDVGALEGAFAGVPAIVIGAGPSLDAALPALREARDSVLLIAVSKALRPMVAAGCPPHMVVTLDLQAVTADYFRGVPGLEDVVLVFDPDATPAIPREYPGPRCSYATGLFYAWARRRLKGRTEFPRGMTVSHQAFYLARHLGADPIALVGVDLAFPDRRTHASGTVYTWGGTVRPDDPHVVQVPSVTGKPVLSHESFRAFIAVFEAEFANTRARVVNCSPSGARIAGAREEELASFLRRHGNGRPLDLAPLGIARDRCRRPDGGRQEIPPGESAALRCAIAEARVELDRVGADAAEGLAAVRRGWDLDPDNPSQGPAIQDLLRAINAPFERVQRSTQFQTLAGRIVGETASLDYHLVRALARWRAGSREHFRLDLVRMRNLFEGFADAARFLREGMADLAGRLEAEGGGGP